MASMGFDTLLSIDGTSLQVSNSTIGKRATILERDGLRGVREHHVRDTRAGPYRVGGGFTCEPSATELAMLLAWAITHGAKAIVVDKVAAVYTYADCYENTLRLSGAQGGLLSCAVDVVGKTEAATGTVTAPESTSPFAYSPDVVLSLAGSSREVQSFELGIDNQIDAERFLNSLTLAEVNATDQIVTLKAVVPYNAANLALYNQALAGAAGSLTLSQDGFTPLVISFGTLQVPAESPEIPGKGEIYLTLNMQARASGASAAIAVTGGTASS